MKKSKKLNFKVAIILVPSFLVAVLILNYLLNAAYGSIIKNLVDTRIEQIMSEISGTLQDSGGVTDLLAQTASAAQGSLSKDQYKELLEGYVSHHDIIYGAGIWLESDVYSKGQQYFAPYVYKSEAELVFTEEWATQEYDYPSQDWYKQAVAADGNIAWTAPYYDGGIIFLTAGKVIKDPEGKMLGVVTVDLDISKLGAQAEKWVIGNNGKTFLLTSDNLYIASSNESEIMKNISEDPNPLFAKVGQVIQSNGSASYQDNTFEGYILSVNTIDQVGWKVGTLVSRKDFFSSLTFIMLGISVLIILLLGIVLLLIAAIIKVVQHILVNTDKLDQGDLTVQFTGKRKDELGVLTKGLNKMVESFREIIKSIIGASSDIKEQTEQTVDQSIQMKNMAQDQANALSEITLTMNEMTNAIGEVVDSANKLAIIMDQTLENGKSAKDSSEDAVAISQKGQEDMDKINREMSTVKESIKAMSGSVADAGHSADEIRNIIKFIENVATQTNLLALNAAIEAARAGEAGRGFSVVADEIRKLAESTSVSTKQISTLVENVIHVIGIAVDQTQKNVEGINNSATLIVDTGASFKDILEAIKKTYSKIQTIMEDVDKINLITQELVSTTQEQSAGSQEILATVENVNEMSQNMVRDTESVVNNANGIKEVSEKLGRIVQRFKV